MKPSPLTKLCFTCEKSFIAEWGCRMQPNKNGAISIVWWTSAVCVECENKLHENSKKYY